MRIEIWLKNGRYSTIQVFGFWMKGWANFETTNSLLNTQCLKYNITNIPGTTSNLTDFVPLTTLSPLHDLQKFCPQVEIWKTTVPNIKTHKIEVGYLSAERTKQQSTVIKLWHQSQGGIIYRHNFPSSTTMWTGRLQSKGALLHVYLKIQQKKPFYVNCAKFFLKS